MAWHHGDVSTYVVSNDIITCLGSTLPVIVWPFAPSGQTIGACRAVWVPGQDLATLHLMHNCGKRILSLHCMLYICLCTHTLYAGDHVSSWPVLMIWVSMIRNNPGNARVCPSLQAPMGQITRAMPGYSRACRRLWVRQSLARILTIVCAEIN